MQGGASVQRRGLPGVGPSQGQGFLSDQCPRVDGLELGGGQALGSPRFSRDLPVLASQFFNVLQILVAI